MEEGVVPEPVPPVPTPVYDTGDDGREVPEPEPEQALPVYDPPAEMPAPPAAQPTLAGQLQQVARAIAPNLPMQVPGAPGMVMQSVEAEGTVLRFTVQSAEVMPAEMMEAARNLAQAIALRDCGVPAMREIVEAGGTLVYRFRFLDGRYVDGEVRDCAQIAA
jgi:hypothetical protein